MNSEDINKARQGLGWSIALGVFMIVLGIGAIAEPFVATIAITFVFSWILLIAGIVRIIHAFQSRRKRSFWSKLLIWVLGVFAGINFLLTGIWMIMLSLSIRSLPNQRTRI